MFRLSLERQNGSTGIEQFTILIDSFNNMALALATALTWVQ